MKQPPNFSIITAIQITCCIPVIYEPIIYNNDYYVDGALFSSYPMFLSKSKNTLGLCIKNKNINPTIHNLYDYISLFLKLLIKENDYELNEYTQNTVEFNINNSNLSFFIKKIRNIKFNKRRI